jgi:hypothetical protein
VDTGADLWGDSGGPQLIFIDKIGLLKPSQIRKEIWSGTLY